MKKHITGKSGEGYIDVCIAVVIFVTLLVIALNLFNFVSIRTQMDQIADELIETATYTGCFGEKYEEEKSNLKSDYFDFDTSYGADAFYMSSNKVQLGDKMWVTVSVDTEVKGVGIFKIPVTLRVKKSGISEKYWK